MKYSDVKRFYMEKYGKTIGELKFKLYLARKTKKPTLRYKKSRRINLFVF